MESIDVDKLQPDPLAAALAGTDKETVTVSGFVCAVDEATLNVCTTRDGTSYISYPRPGVIAAFTDEKSDQGTLLIDAHARVSSADRSLHRLPWFGTRRARSGAAEPGLARENPEVVRPRRPVDQFEVGRPT